MSLFLSKSCYPLFSASCLNLLCILRTSSVSTQYLHYAQQDQRLQFHACQQWQQWWPSCRGSRYALLEPNLSVSFGILIRSQKAQMPVPVEHKTPLLYTTKAARPTMRQDLRTGTSNGGSNFFFHCLVQSSPVRSVSRAPIIPQAGKCASIHGTPYTSHGTNSGYWMNEIKAWDDRQLGPSFYLSTFPTSARLVQVGLAGFFFDQKWGDDRRINSSFSTRSSTFDKHSCDFPFQSWERTERSPPTFERPSSTLH